MSTTKAQSASKLAAPQLSVRAIVLSIVLAMVLAAANTYLGLFAGLTIATAIPAAVVSMAVLRLFGGGHILENNIVQNLPFPEGKAAAEVLKAGENPGRGIRILAFSALLGVFAKILAQSGMKL